MDKSNRLTPKDEQEINESLEEGKNEIVPQDNALAVPDLYKTVTNVGTEEMTQEDLNTPVLKILQPTTQGIDNKKEGYYYRSDTEEQLPEVLVNLVYVTTQETENYNKTGMEKVKMYYGFYADTNEPFKMYIRGWGIAQHRIFQTQLVHLKKKFNVPMFALTINLTTEKQTGTIKDSGKPYTIYKPVFNVVPDEENPEMPKIETKPSRVNFLFETVQRFKAMAQTTTPNDDKQNDDMPF